jgi:hypothetical protein
VTTYAAEVVESLTLTDDVGVGTIAAYIEVEEKANALDAHSFWRPLVERPIPTEYPPFITAGTTFKVDRRFDQWPCSDWRLMLIFAGAQTLAKEATPDPATGVFHIMLTPAETQSLNPAATATAGPLPYSYRERVTALDGSGEVFDVTRDGRIMVEPNFAAAAPGAMDSDEAKMLAVINAVIFGRITVDIQNYAIAGRSVTKIPVAELFAIRRDLKAIVDKQQNPGRFSHPIGVAFPSNLIGPAPLKYRTWGGL